MFSSPLQIALVLVALSQPGRHIAGVDYRGTVQMPHRWGVDFVRQGKYLYATGSESERTFYVVDVSNPRAMRVVAETEAGLYAGRNLCRNGNLVLANHYRWINLLDLANPLAPELIPGCSWEPDPSPTDVRPLYRFQWAGKYVFLACSKPELGLRVYAVEPLFKPRLVAALDVSAQVDAESRAEVQLDRNWYPNAEMLLEDTRLHTSLGHTVLGFDVARPQAPTLLYARKMPGNVVGLALATGKLYVAVNRRNRTPRPSPRENGSLVVLDLTNPRSPRELGRYSDMDLPERVLVDGPRAYLVGQQQVPPGEQHVDGVPWTKGVAMNLNRSMVLHVLDVSDPSRPVRRARLAFPHRPSVYNEAVCRAMAMDCGTLFLADQDYGIRAVDVGNPGRPQLVGSVRTVSHEIREVIPDGRRAYVVNGTSVNAIDVADPSRPALDPEGSLDPVGRWGISLPAFGPNPRYFYSISAGAFEVAIADFGQPRGPRARVVSLVAMPEGWSARDLAWSAGHLFVLSSRENRWNESRFFVFEPTEGGRGLKLVAQADTGRFQEWLGFVVGTDFLVAGDRAFILQAVRKRGPEGRQWHTEAFDLVAVDIRSPTAPRVLPRADLLPTTRRRLAGQPATGWTAGSVPEPSYSMGHSLAYRNGCLYCYAFDESPRPGRPSMLLVYDLHDPAAPKLLSALAEPVPQVSNQWIVRNLCPMGNEPYLVATSECTGAWIIDVSDPHNPRTVWKEKGFPRDSMIGHYYRNAKPRPAYQDGLLYIPRLDRVDLFSVRWAHGPAPADPRLPEAEPPVASPKPIARARHAAAPLKIDGQADDWQDIQASAFERGPASIRWQWEERYFYLAIVVRDADVDHSPAPAGQLPHHSTADHVDLFLSARPAAMERAYGPADLHVSVDLSGRVAFHHQNPRVRGEKPEWLTSPAKLSRAAVKTTADGYLMELALAHEETLAKPRPGTSLACSVIVTDRGQRETHLRHLRVPGYVQVQPGWPVVELASSSSSSADPLTGWRNVQSVPVLRDAECHSIHTYYLTCPESPDGRWVLLYTSADARGYVGRVEIVQRATGERKVLAENVTVEDAHRAACQQWVSGGRRVVFHDLRDGHWVVVCVDVASGQERILARDRQVGFGQPGGDLVAVYSPHWNPGQHRDFELIDLTTGQTRTAVTAEAVKAAYPKWIAEKFAGKPVSIFFPVLSPDLHRVIFKMAAPGGGDFRSGKASRRSGLIGYDLAAGRFLCLRNWGHPAWHPASRAVLDLAKKGLALTDLQTGQMLASIEVPNLGGGHPSFSPDGRLLACDRRLPGPGDQREVLLGDLETGKTLVAHRFENGRGAASWRRNDPHPVFSADGRRIYFNVSADRWTRLHVIQSGR